jgi:hypothetical protein
MDLSNAAKFEGFAVEISVMALRGNPRQIKRFLNSFLFVQRIVQSRQLRVNYELLAAVIGLQLAWPDNYRTLQEDLAVGGENSLSSPRNIGEQERDQWLARYYTRFFTKAGATDQLRKLMQLTAVVAGPEASTAQRLSGPAGELRDENRTKLVGALGELGYTPSKRSERFWYNAKHKSWRFVFLSHYVSLQKHDFDGWHNWRKYLLTREADQAINDAKAPSKVQRKFQG